MRGGATFPVRLGFSKQGKIRFLGHRDLARAFERAFRIAQLPLAFSEGFSPHPKVSFGLALSVGFESEAEYLDVELTEPVDLDALPARLSVVLPDGLDVTAAVLLAERAAALQESVTAAAWRVEVIAPDPDGPAPDPAALEVAVAALLAADRVEVVRRRKGREALGDIRPAVRRLAVIDTTPAGVLLDLEVGTAGTTARPGEVVAALAVHAHGDAGRLAVGRVTRTQQWIERDGARDNPLGADARPFTRAPLTEARAS